MSSRISSPNSLFGIYQRGEYLSVKHDSYFQVYEELLSKYVGKEITFVEIGILNGGSLFMWREFFGPKAKIIGIDLNPEAKKWEKDGFKIFIGSQSDSAFWDNFFSEVGEVDVVLDDGGHTNLQQIVTTDKCIPHIKNGGLLIVEDVHASYLKKFGNPSRYSFINFTKRMIDAVNSRFPKVDAVRNSYSSKVYSVSFYESIVCFHVDERKCFISSPTTNNGVSDNARDFRHSGTFQGFISRLRKRMRKLPVIKHIASVILFFPKQIASVRENAILKSFFK